MDSAGVVKRKGSAPDLNMAAMALNEAGPRTKTAPKRGPGALTSQRTPCTQACSRHTWLPTQPPSWACVNEAGWSLPLELRRAGEKARKPRRMRCQYCKTHQTPQWRGGPNGPRTLCNACGVGAHTLMPFASDLPPACMHDACLPFYTRTAVGQLTVLTLAKAWSSEERL